jgi:ubiquinone/menaquinone biosynthesis C-methylase UbiE
MLERLLEQEVLDSKQDADEYAAYDNTAVNEEFVAQALSVAPRTGRVLDIGTGPADIAILLAQRAPGLSIVAIDLGEHMLGIARENVRRAKLEGRVEIRKVDAKATGFETGSFDMVISNSLVHHIPEPALMFKEVKRVLDPGGALFIKDLHRPDSKAELDQLVATYAKGCTDYQRRGFWESLHAGLTVEEVSDICRSLELLGVEVRRCSDRHWYAQRPQQARE